MTKKHLPPPFAPMRGVVSSVQQKAGASPIHSAIPVKLGTVQPQKASGGPRLFAPPPLAPTRGLPGTTVQPKMPNQHVGQAKLAASTFGSSHACVGCQPHRQRVVQPMMSSHGFSNNWDAKENTKSGFKTNSLVAFEDSSGEYIELGTASNYTSTGEHAEDVAIRIIRDSIGMFEPGRTTKVYFHLTASPCTSTARPSATGGVLPATGKGCAETLVGFFGAGVNHLVHGQNYAFDLTVFCTGLYAPRIIGETQADILEASQEAVNYLDANGITVSGNVRPGPSRRFGIL